MEHKPGVLHKDADGVSRLVCAVVDPSASYDQPSAAPTMDDPLYRLVAPVVRTAVSTARRLRAAQRTATDRHAVTSSYLDTGAPSIDAMREEQLVDPTCIAIRSYLELGHAGDINDSAELRQALWIAREVVSREDGQEIRRIYIGADDVLYRRLSSAVSVPFVPDSLRYSLLTAYHDHLGHPSAARMASLMRSRYYWPTHARRDGRVHG